MRVERQKDRDRQQQQGINLVTDIVRVLLI